MAAHLHDDLVLVLLQNLEVHFVGVGEPHRVAVVACTSINVLNDDELAAFLGKGKLVLQPEHLLHARLRAVEASPLAIVVKGINREHRDLFVDVDTVVAANLK